MHFLIEAALEKKALAYFTVFLLFIGGIVSFFSLGQLEDPLFTIKSAVITTKYPGASPKEVELEVTDRIEIALQEMVQIKEIHSTSRAGESIVKVDIKEEYWADRLPQVWDELRRKVSDVQEKLPPGVEKSVVRDDFGFVYGFVLALSGEDYSAKELEYYAKDLKKELSLVKGVSRVELWGVQPKVIYLEISEKQLSELRISPQTVGDTLKNQNMVVDAGSVDGEITRYRMAPTGEFTNPEEIGELLLRPSSSDLIGNIFDQSQKQSIDAKEFEREIHKEAQAVLRVKDVAKVKEGYLEPATTLMRFDGKPAIGIQIAGADDANIVDVGNQLYSRLLELAERLPVGLSVDKVAWQSDLVDEAVSGFIISLIIAVIIVLIVLIIPSGFRMGCIIGLDLILTILGTFIVMSLMNIPLQRMSLGALIISLGMMVDNSIVIADGIAVKLRNKENPKKAAVDVACSNFYPLLAATLIAILTFYPIYASKEDAGEYCRTLFIVVGTSLFLSWLISIFITPLQCLDFLKISQTQTNEFHTPIYEKFRSIVKRVIYHKKISFFVLIGLLALSIFCFGFVRQMFFPDSSRPQLMIDYWGPPDQRIQKTYIDTKMMETALLQDAEIASVASFIGAGPPRFYLPVDPEKIYPNYAQLLVTFDDFQDIDPYLKKFEPWVEENVTGVMVRFRKFAVGPSNAWPFELRISAPGNVDPKELRKIAEDLKEIASQSELGKDWRLDVQDPVLKLDIGYDQKRGRWSSVDRQDLAGATKRSYDGRTVGLYREKDDLYPIILRNIDKEREDAIDHLSTLQIKPYLETYSVPLSQVVTGIYPNWEEPFHNRYNRRREIAVQGSPKQGITFPQLRDDVIKEIENYPLPKGYELFWDGEYDSTVKAKKSLIPGMVPAVVLILFLLVSVFNAFRPVGIILATIPFAIIGVTFGLLVFNTPFGFMALLGAMSLAGMMNKNIVILLDACNENLKLNLSPFQAIVEASVCRARPVLLAAGTTILGVIPLVFDVFWVSMAITIMVGLAFGSILTLAVVPVFYSLFYKIHPKKEDL